MQTRALLALLALAAAVLLTSAPALAGGAAACLEAADKGQTLRDAHQLVEAREELRACAQEQCPALVRSDCQGWLLAVEKNLPTVVVTARDGAGTNLVDVKVSVDGHPLLSKLDGVAVAMNPGLHTLHFESDGGASLDQQVAVKEGEGNQVIAVVLVRPANAVSSPKIAAGEDADPLAAAPPDGSAIRAAGLVTGGAGLVSLGAAAYFGLRTLSLKSDRDALCPSGLPCTSQTAFDDDHEARIAQVRGLVFAGVGVAALGVGTWLVLSASRGAPASPVASRSAVAARFHVVPQVGARSGGVSMEGAW